MVGHAYAVGKRETKDTRLILKVPPLVIPCQFESDQNHFRVMVGQAVSRVIIGPALVWGHPKHPEADTRASTTLALFI